MIRSRSSLRSGVVAGAVALLLVSICFASYNDLQVSLSGTSGSTVTVSVNNPTSGAETARVQVTVLLDNGLPETLISHNFTVGGGATLSVVLSASRTVSSVIDDPFPIPSSP